MFECLETVRGTIPRMLLAEKSAVLRKRRLRVQPELLLLYLGIVCIGIDIIYR